MTKAKMIEMLNKMFDSYLMIDKMCLDTIIKVDGKQVTLRDRLDEITDTKIALLTAIDALEHDNGWISVKDRMPEFNQKVLVVYNDTDYCNGISIRRLIIAELTVDGYWMEGVIWHPDTSITHWRPLPEPPESEDDAE